ncbi:MAG: hypothetical protein FWF20_02240 [Betaproteobacteria bacterium]|nr:hypothetical protein [Betaproteobacteria bacterium]MCL2885602.1 hypothetical protein [Betaproteobacteria bacterium]
MILEISAMVGATAAVAGLIWRLVMVAKRDGASSLLTTRANETLLHACLLFSWAMFMGEGAGVLLHSAPNEMMAGYGALFGGLFAMCLLKTKPSLAATVTRGDHG